MLNIFQQHKNFKNEILELIQNDHTYIEAVISYSEKYNIDVEFVADLVSKNDFIKDQIQHEAENLNIIKKEARLPI